MDGRRQPSALAYQPSGSSRSWSHGMCREDARQPLPSELDTVSHPRYIIAARDKRSVRYIGKGNHGYDVGAIRTDRPCPARCALYYFEATVLDAGERGALCIGLAGESFSLHRQPGWEPDSFGYHAEDGRKYTDSERGEVYGPAWGAGDVVGCGLVNATRSIFFTRNGQHLGVAFSEVPPQLYPTVGLHSPNEALALNFGEAPFAFDARGHVAALRRESEQQAALHHAPAGLVAGLVRSYLLHHAFADTLEALERDSRAADMDVDAAAGRGCTPAPRGGTSSATCEGPHAAAGGDGGQAGDAARCGEPNGVKRPAPSPPLDCPPLSVCLPGRGARGGGACPKGRGDGGGGGRTRVLAGGAAADELAAVSMEARRQVTAVARRGDAARACELCERLFPGLLKE